jgi:hypothetical protein
MVVFQKKLGFIALIALAVVMALDSAGLAQHHVAPPVYDEAPLEGLLSNRLIPYGRNHNTPVFADYVPLTAETAVPFTAEMARNEYEPLQVGIYVPSSQGRLSKIKISVTIDIPYEVGHLIYVPTPDWLDAWDTDWEYDGRRWAIPMYLAPGNTILSIPSSRSGGFWITFKTDAGTPAGIHKGKIAISASGVGTITRDISVKVHPFELPRPDITFGMFYFVDRVNGIDIPPKQPYVPKNDYPPYRTKHFQEMYLRDIAAHGHNSVLIHNFMNLFATEEFITTGRTPLPDGWRLQAGGDALRRTLDLLDPSEYSDGKVDPKRLIEVQMELYEAAGAIYPDIPVLSFTGPFAAPNKTECADTLRSLTIANAWPEITVYARDEPFFWIGPHPDFAQEQIDAIRQWKRIGNTRTLPCVDAPSAAAWGDLWDIWIVLDGKITAEMLAEAARQNGEVWTYTHNLRITNPHANRYWAGLHMWGTGLTGTYPNSAYSEGPHYRVGASWDPVTEQPVCPGYLPYQSLSYVIVGPDGPIPGVGWEGRREGIDDYRYLQLLETRLAATANPNPVKDAAQAWLDALKTTVATSAYQGVMSGRYTGTCWGMDWHDPDPDHTPDQYRGIRQTAATYIAQLPGAPGELNPPTVPTSYPPSAWEGMVYEKSPIGECITALQSGTTSQKRAAATALNNRSDGATALPALTALLADADVRVPALRAIRKLETTGAAASSAIAELLENENADPYVRVESFLALADIGGLKPELFLTALRDPVPFLNGIARSGWDSNHILHRPILGVMSDSALWEFSYEADELPPSERWAMAGWTKLGGPTAIMLPVKGSPYRTLQLSGSSDQDGYERTWHPSSKHCSIEVRMRLKQPACTRQPQITLRTVRTGESSLLLTHTGVIWSLGENNDTYPSGYSHRLDVTQWHVYRWTVIHTGDDDIESRLYVDGNPEPLVIRKVNWDMTNRNQIVIVPGGCSPAIEVDYVRWTALDADIPASHYFAPDPVSADEP